MTQELSDTVLHKGPCPKCGSKDNNAVYTDGHEHCFTPGCGHYARPSGVGEHGGQRPAPTGFPLQVTIPKGGLKKRGLDEKTLSRYGYGLADFKDQQVQAAPYYSKAGEMVALKLRFPDKSFVVHKAIPDCPPLNECQLFGQHVYGDRFDRRVVITEGEIDAMSVAQALDFKSACVSVNGGAQSAAKCLKASYLWLDRFEEIILWFDDDEPGRAATEECAKLFRVGKVRIAKAGDGCKDASDLLQRNLPGDILQAVYKAQTWRPKGIVNAADSVADVLAPKDDDDAWSYEWPWDGATEMFGPMKPGQVVYHVAGIGVGKTTALAEMETHLIGQGCKMAHMGFEDTRRDVKLRLLSIEANKRLDIEPLQDPEMEALHAKVFGPRLIELFDPETAEWSVDSILGYVRYCAKALDCRVVHLDPLSFIVAGMPGEVDERRALDRVSRDLAALAKELGICVHVSHHLTRVDGGAAHEEGASTSMKQIRGSNAIGAFASVVIGYERNQQAEGEGFLVTQLRALKNRPRSRTGVFGALKYNLETGRLLPTNERFPGPGADREGKGPPAFTSVAEY